VETADLLRALQDIEKRAERGYDDAHVMDTYVDSGGLADALAANDNGIVYGRRGTGNTHALRYLAEKQRSAGDFVVYIDMEKDLGSTEGLYGDPELPVSERASRLLVDVLARIHDELLDEAFDGRGDVDTLDKVLDHFGEVLVSEEVEKAAGADAGLDRSGRASLDAGLTAAGPKAGAAIEATESERLAVTVQTTRKGTPRLRVHFGATADLMKAAAEAHPASRCWFLFDEWSSVPIDLQPYLAEMMRRLFFGLAKVTIRIGAIPHRTEWRVARESGGYVGLEVGAEIFPLLDLDEFVVFPARNREEQTDKATDFFRTLLFRHLNHILRQRESEEIDTPTRLVSLLFTQVTALQEVVRAAEGVPRDAISIVSRAALRAGDRKISTDHVRAAAAQLYQTTKAALLNGVPEARALLDVIIGEVISEKKARAFLLHQDHANDPLIQRLVDDRLLHIIKKGYSNKNDPGARFDVLQIDYGCYVNLLQTQSAPRTLFEDVGDDTAMASLYENLEVPDDDYRAIRQAVLDLPAKLAAIEPTEPTVAAP